MATGSRAWLAGIVLSTVSGLSVAGLAACGGGGDGSPTGAGSAGGGSSAGAGGGSSAGAGGGSSAGAGGGSSAGSGSAGSGGSTLGAPFTYGLNLGYYNPQLNDTKTSQLGLAAGARSHRHKLGEPFLDKWGDTIHVKELTDMLAAGERDLVCFLVGASAAHSNAPSGAADWEREHYAPKGLYEPIFTPDGNVNPGNPWASFVARVVKTYSPYIHTWEVWNEPDQVGGKWQVTQAWSTEAPKASDLVWWNDTIFAYIRMLRITHAVVHKLDPEGKVALGGIGTPSFLSAILRYTDEPAGGAVDAAHPEKGGAYFDVVSYHYYPIFSKANSDGGAKGLVDLRDELAAELSKAGVEGKTFIVTESGAPRFAVGGQPGGAAYAANYLMKSMALGQSRGLRRIDWFILGDSADPGGSTDAFDYMGLYENLKIVSDPAQAKRTTTGTAYATLSLILDGALSDPAATAAVGSPGVLAFRTKGGTLAYVAWAAGTAGEDAKGVVSLPATGPATVYRWDHATTKATETIPPNGGAVEVPITSAPAIVVAP